MSGFKEGLKRQLKEFWAYHRLTNYSTATTIDKGFVRSDALFFVAMTIGFVIFCFQFNIVSGALIIELFPIMILLVGISMGISTRNKTALVNVAPFTPRQRVVFSVLVTLFRAVVACVMVLVVSVIFVLIVALIAYLATGENIFATSEEIVKLSAYQNWLSVLFYAFLICSAFALSHINKSRSRTIATAVYLAVTFLLLIIANSVIGTIVVGGAFKVRVVANLLDWVNDLAHPWILVLIMSILTALSLASAIYFLIARHKSSKL